MITYKELKNFVETCGVRHELNPKKSTYEGIDIVDGKIKFVEKEMINGFFFGMNNISGRSGKSEWQWFWFECYDQEITDDSTFFFVERYSMVNGTSNKGFREGMKAIDTINRRMGIA